MFRDNVGRYITNTQTDIPSDGCNKLVFPVRVIFTGYDIMSGLDIFLLLKTRARPILDLADADIREGGKKI